MGDLQEERGEASHHWGYGRRKGPTAGACVPQGAFCQGHLCTLLLFFVFIILFLAVLDLCCCEDFSLVTENKGYSLVAVRRLLLLRSVDSRASVVAVCRL